MRRLVVLLPAALSGDQMARLSAGERDAESRLWRAVDIFRVCALGYAVALLAMAHDDYRRPWLAWAALVVLTGWTLGLVIFRARPPWVLALDLALGTGAVLFTMVVDHPDRIAAGTPTLPTIWAAAPVLAWAVAGGWRSGLLAGVVVSVADWVEVGTPNRVTVNNIILLLLAGSVIGYAVEVFRAGRRDSARAAAIEAASRERERLARDIHDSVLQFLTFARRRALDLGGPAAEIGKLAGEQEARLRSLVTTGPDLATTAGEADLRHALNRLSSPGLTISGPAEPVMLPQPVVTAVAAATAEALGNVARHAGPGASAWLFLEDEGDVVTVSVRDDGAGFAPGRLQDAVEEGRLGVRSSICGRLAEIGGTAAVTSTPGQGTEVEMRVPRGGRR